MEGAEGDPLRSEGGGGRGGTYGGSRGGSPPPDLQSLLRMHWIFWNAPFSILECPWIFWNAPFSILECPRISKDIPNFWNAPFGTSRLERPVWNAPIFGTPLFSTLKSDWILAGICWNLLERPFSDFGMSRNHLERPFSDFGMSLILFNNFTLTAIETVKKGL